MTRKHEQGARAARDGRQETEGRTDLWSCLCGLTTYPCATTIRCESCSGTVRFFGAERSETRT